MLMMGLVVSPLCLRPGGEASWGSDKVPSCQSARATAGGGANVMLWADLHPNHALFFSQWGSCAGFMIP